MKANTLIASVLLGLAMACPAQTPSPASPKPVDSIRSTSATNPKADPNVGPGLASSPTILKTKSGHAFVLDPSAEVRNAGAGAPAATRSYPLAAALGNAPASGDAAAREAYIRKETGLKNLIAEALKVAGLASPAPGLTFLRDSNALIAQATAAQHDLIADAISALEKKSRPAASPKSATSPTLTLAFPKDAEPGTSQRLTVTEAPGLYKPYQGGYRPTPGGASVTADPMATGTRQLTNPVAPAPFVTRLYSLKALITKVPAGIDDDAHNKRAADAYQAKVEALLGWVKTVLAHSEPAEASFAFSPEAGAFVVKATEAQHDALTQGVAIFETNYGK